MEDYDLIVSSFQSQYGIRLTKELRGMKWAEFSALLSGISPDTVLGRIVSIRSETDKNALKQFTKEQHRIRNEWQKKRAGMRTPEDAQEMLKQLKQIFVDMAGKA